jgi:hypothetical protein
MAETDRTFHFLPRFLFFVLILAGLRPACPSTALSSMETGVGSANSRPNDKIVTPMFMRCRAATRCVSLALGFHRERFVGIEAIGMACAQVMKYGAMP